VSEIIPMIIRTARVPRHCDNYPRCPAGGIQPGEQYEDLRLPPGREPYEESTRWLKHKIHYPRIGVNGGPDGCEMAAAYREHATRETPVVAA
jgi:hypothetical protein